MTAPEDPSNESEDGARKAPEEQTEEHPEGVDDVAREGRAAQASATTELDLSQSGPVHSSRPATSSLLDDLRSDNGMEWIPQQAWLSKVSIDAAAADLKFDLAIDASGLGRPSLVAAGLSPAQVAARETLALAVTVIGLTLSVLAAALVLARTRMGGAQAA